MTELEKIVNRYNRIMLDIGREFSTIVTEPSEETAEQCVVKMVREAKHWLSWYYEPSVDREMFPLKEAYRLKRFIAKYEPMAESIREQPVSKEAIDEYNPLMFETCQWHTTIGTQFSENTERWGLSDMVGQVEFVLEQCSKGNASDGVNLREVIPAMEHFIEKYKPMVVEA